MPGLIGFWFSGRFPVSYSHNLGDVQILFLRNRPPSTGPVPGLHVNHQQLLQTFPQAELSGTKLAKPETINSGSPRAALFSSKLNEIYSHEFRTN